MANRFISKTAETQDQNQNEAIIYEAIPQELENIQTITITRPPEPKIPQPKLVETQTTSTTEVLIPEILEIDSENQQGKEAVQDEASNIPAHSQIIPTSQSIQGEWEVIKHELEKAKEWMQETLEHENYDFNTFLCFANCILRSYNTF